MEKLNFGNSAKFWLGLQKDFDIKEEEKNERVVFEKIKPIRVNRSSKQALSPMSDSAVFSGSLSC